MSEPLRTPGQMQALRQFFKPDGLERLARADVPYCNSHPYYLPGLAALAHCYLEAGDALRLAVAGAHLITTQDEVRMSRADWDAISTAAIAQRRATDPTAVDDGERYPRDEET